MQVRAAAPAGFAPRPAPWYASAVAVALAYLACALIWGTTWFAIRVCIGPGGYPTMAALALRFAAAAALLAPLALRGRRWPRGRPLAALVAAGVLDAVSYALIYAGEERVSGGVAAVLYGTQPLILAAVLRATRIEAMGRRAVVGAGICLGGVALLFLERLEVSPRQGLGVALVLGSVLASTAYAVLMKRHAAEADGLVGTTIFLGVTALVVAPLAIAAGQPLPWPPPLAPSLALAYLAVVGSVVAFLCYFWLLGRTGLVATSSLVFVYPVVALLTDAAFEREVVLGARAYAGAAVILAGLLASLWPARRASPG